MEWLTSAIMLPFLGGTALCIVFLYLFVMDRSRPLLLWTISWGLYALRYVFMLFYLEGDQLAWQLIINQSLALWSAVLLAIGAWQFVQRPLKLRLLLGLAAGLNAWIIAGVLFRLSLMTVSLPTFSVLGIIYFGTGWIFIRHVKLSYPECSVAGWIFIIWGAHKLTYPFLRPVVWLAPWGYFISGVLAFIAALSIIMLYLRVARERLSESEARFRRLSDNAQDVIFRMSLPDGTYDYVSPSSQALTGYSPDEFYHNPYLVKDILHPDYREYFRNHVTRLLNGECDPEYDYKIIDKSGRERWLNQTNVFVADSEGNPVAIEGIVRDITKRKMAEVQLRESERKLSTLMANLPGMAYRCHNDNSWTMDFVSSGCKELTGLSPSALIENNETTYAELILPEDRDEVWNKVQAALAEHSNFEIEYRISTADGGQKHVWEKGVGIYENGELLFLEGFVNDITDRKQSKEALENSERRFRELFHNIPACCFTFDRDGVIQDWNRACEDLYGWTVDQVIGRSMFDLLVQKKNVDQTLRQIAAVFQGQSFEGLEFEDVRADDSLCHVLVNHYPFMDSQGEVIYGLCAGLDITDRKQAEREKESLQSRLRQAQKMEALGTLAGGIAHDFNNILGGVMGYTELALHEARQGSKLEHKLHQVLLAGKRAAELVQQILNFSRQTEQEHMPLQMGLIVKEATKLLRSSTPSTITFREDIGTDLPLVFADPTQIHQIVMNLCTNAVQAMNDDGGTLSISLQDIFLEQGITNGSALLPGPYLKLCVKDTGPGIPSLIKDSIFDPYFTTKDKGQGTGLGLAMVYSIVKNLNGSITVVNNPDRGATFEVLLPVDRMKDVCVPGSFIDDMKNVEPLPSGCGHVLLIDDEPSLVDVGQQVLEGLGYSVTTFTNAVKAYELFQSDPDLFDVVITGQSMPQLSGAQLARRILAIRPDMPIILCTGYSNFSAEQARSIGIKMFIQKPIMKEDLAKAVAGVAHAKEVS